MSHGRIALRCLQKEAQRFLAALAKRCALAGSATVTAAQLYACADDLELAVPSMDAFLAELNDAGVHALLSWTLDVRGCELLAARRLSCRVGGANLASVARTAALASDWMRKRGVRRER